MEYEEAVSKVTLQQIIRDLEPSTSYTFFVKAYTSHGASKPSESATESTRGEGECKAEPSGTTVALLHTVMMPRAVYKVSHSLVHAHTHIPVVCEERKINLVLKNSQHYKH